MKRYSDFVNIATNLPSLSKTEDPVADNVYTGTWTLPPGQELGVFWTLGPALTWCQSVIVIISPTLEYSWITLGWLIHLILSLIIFQVKGPA